MEHSSDLQTEEDALHLEPPEHSNAAGINAHRDPVAHANAQSEASGFVEDAKVAHDAERRMSLLQGLRTYPKAMAWSFAFSTAVVMEAYDVNLLASFYAMPEFTKKYGTCDAQGNCQLTAAWQSGLSQGSSVGEILGLFISGYLADRFGYRKMMLGSLSLTVAFIFIVFFSPNVQALEAGEVLCGIPWGVFQVFCRVKVTDSVMIRC